MVMAMFVSHQLKSQTLLRHRGLEISERRIVVPPGSFLTASTMVFVNLYSSNKEDALWFEESQE